MSQHAEKKPNIEQLLALVQDVLLVIRDNHQNMKDCAKLLVAIQNIIEPKKRSRWERIKDIFS